MKTNPNWLKTAQVPTPYPVIDFYWHLLKEYRPQLSRVMDMGAGDGRFALGGNYENYDGIEIDNRFKPTINLPQNAEIKYDCAFKDHRSGYDACIGNPPYLRHHEIENKWRERVVDRLHDELDIRINQQCNMYIYFLCLSLIKTKMDGIVALVIPYDWAYRPSAKPVREYLKKMKWAVDVYKFTEPIFKAVETTASITVWTGPQKLETEISIMRDKRP